MADPYRAPRPEPPPSRDAMRPVLLVVGCLAAAAATAAFVTAAREGPAPPAPVPSAKPPAMEAAAAGVPSRRCADHHATAEAFLSENERAHPGCKLPSFVREAAFACWEGPHTTWAMHVDSLTVNATAMEEPCQEMAFVVSLVHVSESGDVRSARPLTHEQQGTNLDVHPITPIEMHVSFFDYDGDGEVEPIVLGHTTSGMPGHDQLTGEIWTFKSGAVLPYAPASPFHFGSVRDIDGDGRPDLMTRGPYENVAEGRCYDEPTLLVDPIFPAHSLGDGTFSATDLAARKFVGEQCRTGKGDAMRLLCARLRGEKPAAAPDADCDGTDELLAVTPPFRL